MICFAVGFGGSGGPSSAAEGPPFFFLSVVKMSKSSSGGAAFFADAFFAGAFAAGAFVADVFEDVPEAGAPAFSFPFFAMLTKRKSRGPGGVARFHGLSTLSL